MSQFHTDRPLGEALAESSFDTRRRVGRFRFAGIGQIAGFVRVERDGLWFRCALRACFYTTNHARKRQNDDPLFRQSYGHGSGDKQILDTVNSAEFNLL